MFDSICICFVIMGILLLILGNYNIRKNENNIKLYKNKSQNFAILVPARDESKVIDGLLKSIKKQTVTVDMKDVYVIVEEKKDKTVTICKKYGATVVFRTNPERQRKGYALDEAIKKIEKDYDLYFIFDADNVLDQNYIKEMMETYCAGYDIGIGYRNCKNGNDNVIAACSSLTFSMVNTLGNSFRNKYNVNSIISGTGFYIKGKWIKKWHGYPFCGLTEDYELSLYAILNDMTTYYNDKAIFYDEQPTKYKQTVKQRVRWIKGYFEARKKYVPLIAEKMNKIESNYGSKYNVCIGVRPYIYIAIGVILYVIKSFMALITRNFNRSNSVLLIAIILVCVIVIVYIVMMIITIIMLKRDKLNLSKKMKMKTILYNPIYLLTYVSCALKALFIKEVVWEKIEHKVNIK